MARKSDLSSLLLAGNKLPSVASQFASQILGSAVQFCDRDAESCVKYMVHARAAYAVC